MDQIVVICLYCGKEETKYGWFRPTRGTTRCSLCNDPNLKVRTLEKRDVFGYNYKSEEIKLFSSEQDS